MSDHDAKHRVQRQFGTHASGYVSSPAHAKSYSLDRLIELLDPQPGWHALDLATGGGHTALGVARRGPWMVSTDLTLPMLRAAREHIMTQLAGRDDLDGVAFAQLDAEHIPFVARAFDAVTCRIAPHHFPDVAGFVREAARVTRPGGVVAVIDQLSPGEPKTARYINAFERLRDPSHIWAYGAPDWQGFFSGAGLEVFHYEDFDTWHDLTPWAARMGCSPATITRLHAMLVQAPAPAAAWMRPQIPESGDPRFVIRQFLMLGRKSVP
jgi:ubiquinone/menaquinone biosynthesis C-methylase UbiE